MTKFHEHHLSNVASGFKLRNPQINSKNVAYLTNWGANLIFILVFWNERKTLRFLIDWENYFKRWSEKKPLQFRWLWRYAMGRYPTLNP